MLEKIFAIPFAFLYMNTKQISRASLDGNAQRDRYRRTYLNQLGDLLKKGHVENIKNKEHVFYVGSHIYEVINFNNKSISHILHTYLYSYTHASVFPLR